MTPVPASRAVVGVLLVASLCIGCSSGGRPAAAPTTEGPTTVATPPTTVVAPPTTVSSKPTTTTGSPAAVAAGPLRCQPSSLNATVTDQGGAVGHGGEVVVLRLVAGGPCTLYGYPGLGLKGPAGQTVPLTVDRQTQAGFLLPYVKAAQVLLSAASPASFGIEWINMFNPTATTLVVTPPDDFTTITVGGGVQGGVPDNTVVTVTAVTTGQLQGPSQNG